MEAVWTIWTAALFLPFILALIVGCVSWMADRLTKRTALVDRLAGAPLVVLKTHGVFFMGAGLMSLAVPHVLDGRSSSEVSVALGAAVGLYCLVWGLGLLTGARWIVGVYDRIEAFWAFRVQSARGSDRVAYFDERAASARQRSLRALGVYCVSLACFVLVAGPSLWR